MKQRKTFKREFACLAGIVWLLLAWLHFSIDDAALASAFSGSYSVATTLIWTFIGSMFGLHHVVDKSGQVVGLAEGESYDPPSTPGRSLSSGSL